MFKSGIRNRLIVSFLILIILTLGPLGAYALWYFHRHNVENLTATLYTEAKLTESLLVRQMTGPMEKAGIDSQIKELSAKLNLRLTIIDPNGVVIADSWENPSLMENHSDRPEIQAALVHGAGKAIRYSSTLRENMLYVAVPIILEQETVGIVRSAATLALVEGAFDEIRNVLLVSFFLASLLGLTLSFRMARRYTAPLEEITAAARRMGEGALDERISVKTGDEVEILAHTLNTLAANLDDKVNEINAEKNKLELILEHMDNAVVLLDRYGKVITINKRAAEIFEIRTDMLGQHNLQVIGNSLLDKAAREAAERKKSNFLNLTTNIRGVKRVFQVFLAPVAATDSNVTAVVTVFHDITALQEFAARKADFVANASHELGTPLTSIRGFAETLLDGAMESPELRKKFIKIIHTEADRMHRLVQDLLQLARLDSSEYRQQLKVQPVDVAPVVESIIRQLAPLWQEKSLAISVEEPAVPVRPLVQPDWFNQIIINLIDNAIKYTPEGGQITIRWRREGTTIVLTVRDTGIGIPAKDLPRIFDRFYRVDRARTRSAGGTGLGLAIVKHIVETMGGTINAVSQVDLGTTFIVTLPAASE